MCPFAERISASVARPGGRSLTCWVSRRCSQLSRSSPVTVTAAVGLRLGGWLTRLALLGFYVGVVPVALTLWLLGVLFVRERLGLSKWIPVGLAAVGVVYLTISYGSLPWISLALAGSFARYGFLRKTLPITSASCEPSAFELSTAGWRTISPTWWQ